MSKPPIQSDHSGSALTSDEIAALLADFLFIHWRGIPSDFKSRYRLDVWRIFTNAVIVAANHTSNLHRFSHLLCDRLSIELGTNEGDRQALLKIFERNLDRLLLRSLRDDAEYIVLLTRNLADKRRAQYEEKRRDLEILENLTAADLEEALNSND